ncbi:hypothetical protein PC128_g25664 [Phytophthora cactorum]|nr:hypothetical protein PC128_g25664 [Phytophthora cactorum]
MPSMSAVRVSVMLNLPHWVRANRQKMARLGRSTTYRAGIHGVGLQYVYQGLESSSAAFFQYSSDEPIVRRRKDNVYCYLSHAGSINDVTISAFIDSGALFNAIDLRVVERLGLNVVKCSNPSS